MRRGGQRLVFFALGGLAVLAIGSVTLFAVLARDDAVPLCPTLVVLNGDVPARADEAARLYRVNGDGEVWLTNDPQSADARGDLGTLANRKRLVAHGVPADAIRIVPGEATGTRVELSLVAQELRRRQRECAVVITSPLHGPRVRVTWRWRIGAAPRLIVRQAPNAAYAGWRTAVSEITFTMLAVVGISR
jgi:uncharacterized SAM-binding protein YcdF (DUF218 family)